MDDRMIVVYAASRNLYPWLPMAYMSLLRHNPAAARITADADAHTKATIERNCRRAKTKKQVGQK